MVTVVIQVREKPMYTYDRVYIIGSLLVEEVTNGS